MTRASYQELEEAWQSTNPGSRESGTVSRIVCRGSVAQMPKTQRPPGYHVLRSPMHVQPTRVELCPDQGLIGDRWNAKKHKLGDQLSLGSVAVAQLVACGNPDRYHLFGNNFLVDFDLSADALPAGTQLRIGTATIEITDEPFTPCNRFQARFGKAARRWVGDEAHAGRHLRGRYARVITGGHVQLGDTLSRKP